MTLPTDEDDRCGYLIHLPEGHPFNAACRYMHDPAFSAKHAGTQGRSRRVVDWVLLKSWLGTARDRKSAWLAAQALVMWPFAKIFGRFLWVEHDE